jgi:predicted alpha-1,2-mannosidase
LGYGSGYVTFNLCLCRIENNGKRFPNQSSNQMTADPSFFYYVTTRASRWPLLLLAILALTFCKTAGGAATEPVDLVYPLLDTANSRWFYFDSASRPFGMVNLSPDTEVDGAWGSGYRYNTLEIKGFSHVHAWQLSGLSVMPVSDDRELLELKGDYYSEFSHEQETVSPGYHRVRLGRYGIDAELTATERVGFHRYTYGRGKKQGLLVDLGGKLGPSEIISAEVTQLSARTLHGNLVNAATMRRPKDTPIFFYIESNRDIESWQGWQGDTLQQTKTIAGADIGLLLEFGEQPGKEPLLIKAGLSYVSSEQARRNLQTELPHWDFARIRQEAREDWNRELGKIRVEGGSLQQRQRFYTDLWHALQGRRTISDANGQYSDFTGPERRIRRVTLTEEGQPEYGHHNSDSFWGAQWTIQTLWPLAYPKRSSDMTRSLLTYYRDGGMVPRGPAGGNYTYVMVGASSTPFIVSNWQKGIRDFDVEEAYAGLRANHMPGGIMERSGYEHVPTGGGGFSHYLKHGHVPYPPPGESKGLHRDGAGMTLEYAYQDWALAQLAKALGRREDCVYFSQRGLNYRNIFDASSGFMRPKDADGHWFENFDPYAYKEGFVESNAAQASWFVPHAPAGLAELMGGRGKAADRLNESFEQAAKQGFTSGTSHDQENREELRRVPINYGNQPSMQTAFLFNAFGRPWLTQYWSREVIAAVYSQLTPHSGYSGDEDQGLMGALAVLMKIGLFQLDGGVTSDPVYEIGSPIFDRVTIMLDPIYYPGREFIIETVGNSDANRYVQNIELNGKPVGQPRINHSDIVTGGKLRLHMGPEPLTSMAGNGNRGLLTPEGITADCSNSHQSTDQD